MKHLEVSIAPLYQGRDEGNYIIDLKRDGKVLSIFYGGNLETGKFISTLQSFKIDTGIDLAKIQKAKELLLTEIF